jgi:hypothetical protein
MGLEQQQPRYHVLIHQRSSNTGDGLKDRLTCNITSFEGPQLSLSPISEIRDIVSPGDFCSRLSLIASNYIVRMGLEQQQPRYHDLIHQRSSNTGDGLKDRLTCNGTSFEGPQLSLFPISQRFETLSRRGRTSGVGTPLSWCWPEMQGRAIFNSTTDSTINLGSR